MLDQLSNRELALLIQQLNLTRRQYRLLQVAPLLQSAPPRNKRTERGAYVHPELAEETADFERLLIKSYRQLGSDWLKSLSGSSDDIASGRLLQAKKPPITRQEELDALDYFEVPEDEADKRVDKNRLVALLTLLALWKSRHLSISDGLVDRLFERGRKKALSDAKRSNAAEGPETTKLKHEVLNKYEDDIERLKDGLENGTRRSDGLRRILDTAATVGAAALLLRRLFDSEAYRVSMFAESAAWTAYQQGERAGAIEATLDVLKSQGHPFPQSLPLSDLTDEEKEELPRYRWSGPQDSRNCEACASKFDEPDIYALSAAELPLPEEICLAGRACRHIFQIVS